MSQTVVPMMHVPDVRATVDWYVSIGFKILVDDLYRRFKDRVQVVEGPHNTFYGMLEFIIRDINGV